MFCFFCFCFFDYLRHSHWTGFRVFRLLEGSRHQRYVGAQFHIAGRRQGLPRMLRKSLPTYPRILLFVRLFLLIISLISSSKLYNYKELTWRCTPHSKWATNCLEGSEFKRDRCRRLGVYDVIQHLNGNMVPSCRHLLSPIIFFYFFFDWKVLHERIEREAFHSFRSENENATLQWKGIPTTCVCVWFFKNDFG